MSTDLEHVERRARRAYEGARLRRAMLGVAPVLVIVAVAVCLGIRPTIVLALGGVLLISGTVLLWYGRDPGRALLPGIAAGLLPLSLALCAKQMGHACVGDQCMTLCLPACTVGGIGAGIFVAWYGLRRQRTVWFWALATGITVLTGALGCSCVGFSGVVGLAIGFVVGVGPGLVSAVRRRSA